MAKVQKSMDSSSLSEVVDRILDKGIVIDAFVKVSLVGIELLSIEARVVIASVETYLKYAEAIGLTASAATPACRAVLWCLREGRRRFDSQRTARGRLEPPPPSPPRSARTTFHPTPFAWRRMQ